MENYLKQLKEEELLKIIKISNSFVELTKNIGLDPYKNNNKKRVERYIKKLNISVDNFDTVKRLKESKNRWNKERLEELVLKYDTYNDILIDLGVLPVTTNYNKLKKCFNNFEINFDKLKKNKDINNIKIVNWDDKEYIETVIKNSYTYRDILIKLNIGIYGNNYLTLKKYIKEYNIDTSHFIKNFDKIKELSIKNKKDLKDILVENSNYSRACLKKRLYKEGLKERKCELCEQGEEWNGKHMSLILDHINGINNDNRLENLRIVCPNCNATLDTHCGKNNSKRNIKLIENGYNIGDKVNFSKKLTKEHINKNIEKRKIERPPYDKLINEIKEYGYSGTGRKYGVSDNAIRKWVKNYEKNGI